MEKNKKISLYGGTGFVGGAYHKMFGEECALIPYSQRRPKSTQILYFISTIHNYNVFDAPYLDVETNLKVLLEVLEQCRDRNDVVFNFISSWFVYGKTPDLPAREDSPCSPRGFYSITKRTAEELLISYCETFGINYRILRLSNVYGPSDTQASRQRNALQHLIREIVNERDVNLYDRGENIRDFLHVKDICRAINLVIHKGNLNEIINIGSGSPQKFIDLMEYTREKTGSTSSFKFIDPPHFHKVVQVQDMYLDITKLKALGFTPHYNMEKGLDEIIQEYTNNE